MSILMDPTGGTSITQRARLERPVTLNGQTLGLLDIAKARGNVFLDRLAARLSERGINIRRYSKPTFARVAPQQLKQQIAGECDAVVEALAD